MPVHPSVTVVWAALRCAGRPTFPSRVVWRVRTLSDRVRVKVFCAAIHPEEMADALAKKAQGRQKFQHEGRTVYEWEQTLDEVLIYITPPPGITAAQLDCKIKANHLTLGLRGADKPFIDEDFPHKVLVDESMWTLDEGVLEISLQKMAKAETWEMALKGHGQMDAFTRSEVQKKLMLERFGEENPGFDFSGAEFSGAAPNPREFMGGVKYK